MSAPRFAPCKCGHVKVDHDALAPQCSAAGCECLRYRPDVPGADQTGGATRPAAQSAVAAIRPPAATTANTGPTVEQILAAGKRSSSKRLNAQAEKITAQLEDLRAKLHAERRATEEKRKQDAVRHEARAEVERLERELAAARARAKGGPPPDTQERDRSQDRRHRRLSRLRQGRAPQHRRAPVAGPRHSQGRVTA